MYCSKCGAQNYEDANYCTQCGQELNNQTQQSYDRPVVSESKSKLAAGILGILLGIIGIHNFYLGYTQKAVIQLLLGTIGAILIIGPIISGVWGLIEGIMILTGSIAVDANGVPLKD